MRGPMPKNPQFDSWPVQDPAFDSAPCGGKLAPAQQTRRKGSRMYARRGQDGNVEIRGNFYYGRYRKDSSDGTRPRPRVKLAPITSMTYSEAQRMWRQRLEEMGVNSLETFQRAVGPTFRQQAEVWYKQMKARRRKPVKPSVLVSWRGALDNHLFPLIGDLPMADAHNGALRDVVSKLVAKGLSAQTITTYTRPLKMVVDSAKDHKGNALYPVKWDNEFADLPTIDPEKQNRPTITAAAIEQGLATCRNRERHLFALLAGSDLRIGEALALRVGSLSADGRVVHVRQALWRKEVQDVKTKAGKRDVDVPAELAEVLARYADGRPKEDFLFATRTGNFLSQRNVLRRLTTRFGKGGFHRLRRFRAEQLRRAGVPSFLERYWMGHSQGKNMSDHYVAGLLKDVEYRRSWSDKVALGFSLAAVNLGSCWTQELDPCESDAKVSMAESLCIASN